ncbi:MAG: hypothetical protein BWX64_01679 [Acidobacteria bacterium ADurb.Bin051]|nr:MAG: hypothetical protein BWX64_01679 [Acidobacteria bacterium ADurb.Bin051]
MWLSPNGLPIASTVSPISRSPLVPSGTAGRSRPATLSSARSAPWSEPSTSASSSRPSSVVTTIRDAPSMTWALVTTNPAASTISPEPSDWARRARPPKRLPKNGSGARTIASAEMLTTAGETRSTARTTALRRPSSWAAAGASPASRAKSRNHDGTDLRNGIGGSPREVTRRRAAAGPAERSARRLRLTARLRPVQEARGRRRSQAGGGAGSRPSQLAPARRRARWARAANAGRRRSVPSGRGSMSP